MNSASVLYFYYLSIAPFYIASSKYHRYFSVKSKHIKLNYEINIFSLHNPHALLRLLLVSVVPKYKKEMRRNIKIGLPLSANKRLEVYLCNLVVNRLNFYVNMKI